MTTAASQRDQVVNDAIREISHIATLPEITLRIVELVENPRSTAQDLRRTSSHLVACRTTEESCNYENGDCAGKDVVSDENVWPQTESTCE